VAKRFLSWKEGEKNSFSLKDEKTGICCYRDSHKTIIRGVYSMLSSPSVT
jgi:hypothetical protein